MTDGIVLAPDWLVNLQTADKVVGVADSYNRVPLVFRAARLRANSMRRVPLHIEKNGKETDTWDVKDEKGRLIDPKDLIYKTELGLLLSGGGFWLHLRNRHNFEKGLQWLNPFSMQIIYVAHERRFYQFLNAYMTEAVEQYPKTAQGYWTDDEMHLWREYNPLDDVRFGVSAAANALQDSQLLFYLSRMASVFFESGAMPMTILPIPPGTDPKTEQDLNNWFKRSMSGVRNAFRVLALRIGPGQTLQPTSFEPNLKKYETPILREGAIDAVAWAFDIPKTLLTAASANRATADNEFRHYLTQTIVPRTEFYQGEIDRYLEEARSPYRLIFAPEEITELQEDEQQRAQSYSLYVGAGMPHEVATAVLGIDIPSSAEAAWNDFLAKERASQIPPPPSGGRVTERIDETLAPTGQPIQSPTPAERQPANTGSSTARALIATEAAKSANHTGIMVALDVPASVGNKLLDEVRAAWPDNAEGNPEWLPPEELHVTLAFLGDSKGVKFNTAELLAVLRVFAATHRTLRGKVGGIGLFGGDGDTAALYASFDCPELPAFRQDLTEMLDAAGFAVDDTHGFTAHITLAYIARDLETMPAQVPELEVSFNDITLAWAGKWTALPLEAKSLLAQDLDKWERKALKRLDKKQRAACDFESEHIPALLAAQVGIALQEATEADAVKAIFEEARASETALPFQGRPNADADRLAGYRESLRRLSEETISPAPISVGR